MNPEIESKIRYLGLLALAQLEALEHLNPEDSAQISQFEKNSAQAIALITELAALLEWECSDHYDFFHRLTEWAADKGSNAAENLALCLPKIAALQGRE